MDSSMKYAATAAPVIGDRQTSQSGHNAWVMRRMAGSAVLEQQIRTVERPNFRSIPSPTLVVIRAGRGLIGGGGWHGACCCGVAGQFVRRQARRRLFLNGSDSQNVELDAGSWRCISPNSPLHPLNKFLHDRQRQRPEPAATVAAGYHRSVAVISPQKIVPLHFEPGCRCRYRRPRI